MWTRRVIVGVVVLAMGAACSSDDDPEEVRSGDREATTYRGSFTVLESPEHGPQLCGAMDDSLPPQCGGPDVVGWRWDLVDGEESASGTTWGEYEVTGTWDGSRLTLTEPPAPPHREPPEPDPNYSTPCPEPAGGWAVVDPVTATQSAPDAAKLRARGREDFAGLWRDLGGVPRAGPTEVVLNVRVTGDVEAAEADLREVWGGALCVSSGEHRIAELTAIQHELFEDPDSTGLLISAGVDEYLGVVEVEAFVDDGLQAELDDRYGPGVVTVEAQLEPVE